MKSIIYFCIIFFLVMSFYYTSFSKEEKIQLTIFTNDELNNFADNATKFVNNVTDKSVSMAKDGYDIVVAQFQTDNSSKAKEDSSPKSVADNETILKGIESVIESVSDNISKTVIMFGEFINENILDKDNSTKKLDNSTTK